MIARATMVRPARPCRLRKGAAIALTWTCALFLPLILFAAPKTVAARPAFHPTFVGDSIALGFAASSVKEAFPEQLESAWRVKGTIVAIPGSTASPKGSPYGPSILGYVGRIPADSSDVFVEEGTNDLGFSTNAQFLKDYTDLIGRIRSRAPDALVWCLGPWQDPGTINAAGGSAVGFDAIIQHACGGNFIDIDRFYNGAGGQPTRGPAGAPTPLGPADGFHPNDLGNSLIASAIATALTDNYWHSVSAGERTTTAR
jgi:lysophospholipase L1-like esterase